MILYLLRHAIAVERGSSGYDHDSARPLTPKGERRMRRSAEGMLALGLSYDLILSSPYVRAKQTADIVAEVCNVRDGAQVSAALAPDGNPRQVIEELNHHHGARQDILLVGHEPYLSRLISTLVTGSSALTLVMKKGGLCKLSIDALRFGRCATMECLLTPRQLRLMA
jgi:phosphohistidine phosphatase